MELEINSIDPEITEEDKEIFLSITTVNLSPEQERMITEPHEVIENQDSVLAVHWHPEFIPMDMIKKRVNATYPNKKKELIIPTDHNVINSYNGYCGVEVDCSSPEFNRKTQFLVHFRDEKKDKMDTFKHMMKHTHNYRSGQLFNFINTILKSEHEEKLQLAAEKTGATKELVDFVKVYTRKVDKMLIDFQDKVHPIMIRNKTLTNFFGKLKDKYDSSVISRVEYFLKAVKEQVKKTFSLDYFYTANEVIEEVRSIGGGIVIPHPEQFWPVLLADYDVDGYEVWNPQSQKFTEFLINVVIRGNKTRKFGNRPILITMGDDCHMGEKVKDPDRRKGEKFNRQVGYQPAWNDLLMQKSLERAGVTRESVIDEYRQRLDTY